MTLFLLQRRILQAQDETQVPEGPLDVAATITLAPEDLFGVSGAGHRMVVRSDKPFYQVIDLHEGVGWLDGEVIDPLELTHQSQGIELRLNGNHLDMSLRAESIASALEIAQAASLVLPATLTLRTGVYVRISQFRLRLAGQEFAFIPVPVSVKGRYESAEHVADTVQAALDDWQALGNGRERLLSALYYYRHARRLSELQPDRVALLPEVLLNLAKALEILLSMDRNKARARAKEWGLSERQVGQWIVPILLLRSKLDVAHASFGPLSEGERGQIAAFADTALERVGVILGLIVDGVKAGRIALPPVRGSLDTERRNLLKALAEYIQNPDDDRTQAQPDPCSGA